MGNCQKCYVGQSIWKIKLEETERENIDKILERTQKYISIKLRNNKEELVFCNHKNCRGRMHNFERVITLCSLQKEYLDEILRLLEIKKDYILMSFLNQIMRFGIKLSAKQINWVSIKAKEFESINILEKQKYLKVIKSLEKFKKISAFDAFIIRDLHEILIKTGCLSENRQVTLNQIYNKYSKKMMQKLLEK